MRNFCEYSLFMICLIRRNINISEFFPGKNGFNFLTNTMFTKISLRKFTFSVENNNKIIQLLIHSFIGKKQSHAKKS